MLITSANCKPAWLSASPNKCQLIWTSIQLIWIATQKSIQLICLLISCSADCVRRGRCQAASDGSGPLTEPSQLILKAHPATVGDLCRHAHQAKICANCTQTFRGKLFWKKENWASKDADSCMCRVGGFDQSGESLSYLNLNLNRRQPICHFSPVYKKFASHQSFPITTGVTRNIIHFQT